MIISARSGQRSGRESNDCRPALSPEHFLHSPVSAPNCAVGARGTRFKFDGSLKGEYRGMKELAVMVLPDISNVSVLTALVGSWTPLLIAVAGWIVSYLQGRNAKRLSRQQKRIERLEHDGRARIAVEKAACEWLSEALTRTEASVQQELRRRTRNSSGLSPRMGPRDFR